MNLLTTTNSSGSDGVTGNDGSNISLFMAVPTVYAKLLQAADKARSTTTTITTTTGSVAPATATAVLTPAELTDALVATRNMRAMISGSAALPQPVMQAWRDLTGHVLLERFGMTEIGMGLSNSYKGERVEGSVGKPLPGVQCRLVDEQGEEVREPEVPGELRIKGSAVFKEYLNRPAETAAAFDKEGWFRTGDIAQRRTSDGNYVILGRNSTDIIKSGGYKLSALEIEREILAHPQVAEVAVVGAEDVTYGQVVVAVIKPKVQTTATRPSLTQTTLAHFLQDRLAVYKQPKKVFVLDDVTEIPRNHLGKVNKKKLLTDLNIAL